MKLKLPKITKANLLSKQFIVVVIIVDLVLILLIVGLHSLAKSRSTYQVGTISEFTKVVDCFSLQDNERLRCLDSFVKSYSETTQKNVRQVLADLETLRSTNTTIEESCHVISHAVGRYTYTKFSNVGDAFEACDLTCNSGCYHGVMERMFFTDEDLERGTQHLSYDEMAEKVPGICDASRFSNPTMFVIFQCYHGLGHAVNYFSDYDLDQALAVCDLVESEFDRMSCYGGAFMENVTAFERGKRDIKRDDPHYPCNRVDQKYRYECYGMQTSIMLELGLTYKQIADECHKAGPLAYRCFDSYGRDLSNLARSNNMSELVKACEVYADGYEINCISTASAVLIDSAGNGRFAYAMCDALTQDANKDKCFTATANYLESSFYFTSEQITEDCLKHSMDDQRCENHS